jgi:hypothetical protein
MGLRASCWPERKPGISQRARIEEKITMTQKRATARRWTVIRQFEPNRLAGEIMARAYGQVIPGHVRVMAAEREADEPGGERPPAEGLVVEPMTNEAVAG